MPRKVVQVASVFTYETAKNDDGEYNPIDVLALCDDGSVWSYELYPGGLEGGWRKLPDIPQE